MKFSPLFLAFALLLSASLFSQQAYTDIVLSGGPGTSFENAFVIKAPDSKSGTKSQNLYIQKHYLDSKVISHTISESKGKTFDIVTIENQKDGKKVSIYFDITSFYGKS